MILRPQAVSSLTTSGLQCCRLALICGRSSKSIAIYCWTVANYCSDMLISNLYNQYTNYTQQRQSTIMSHMIKAALPRLAKDLYSTQRPVSNVYIHLPFCQKKCHFCAFPVHAVGTAINEGVSQIKQSYLASLISQIELSKPFLRLEPGLKSLYIGGGTPSLFDPSQISQICNQFEIEGAEVTLQMNPTEIDQLAGLKQIPINRFSLGIQTFDKKILRKMNRLSQVHKDQIYDNLKAYRPHNLSLDFILDFCLEDEYFEQMLNFIAKISPEHVTLYMLEINQNSYLQANFANFRWLPRQDKVVERYIEVSARLTGMGYHHYQISNFAKGSRYYSQHNQCYWAGNRQFLAYGMGATSLTKGFRITRPTNVSQYHRFINRLTESMESSLEEFKLDVSDQNSLQKQLEAIFMSGLRWKDGIRWDYLQLICKQRYSPIRAVILASLKAIQEQKSNLIRWDQIEQRIALICPLGYLFADEVSNRIATSLQTINIGQDVSY